MRLCWNTIVKNEAKILERCIKSLLPYVDCAAVTDTGSTDNTIDLILAAFDTVGKPVEITRTSFVNFEQARNEGLRNAREGALSWDYLLLVDADMTLEVADPSWLDGLTGDSYDMLQKASAVSYWNRRLLSRKSTANYTGVTHEYLQVDSAGKIDPTEAHFIDHFDGANRPGKYARDIALLTKALETETNPGLIQRYTYYLAQTYFDMGRWPLAQALYHKRTTLGGYAEEVWDAQQKMAHCLGNMKLDDEFVYEMLRAYEMRPHRAEVLYDLAKYYRLRGENHISLLFSDLGTRAPNAKDDILFVNHGVYATGLKEEFAICAYYDPERRDRGAIACNEVALSKPASALARTQARLNQYWYLKPLVYHIASFKPRPISLPAPDGYAFTNPSVVLYQGQLYAILRGVNYLISPEGQYVVRSTGRPFDHTDPIHTRNVLVRLGVDAEVKSSMELSLPDNWPETQFTLVRGFEDSRLFVWRNELWTLSTVRELTKEGWCEQVLSSLAESKYGSEWKRILPRKREHEKNWMPKVDRDGSLSFVYRLDSMVSIDGEVTAKHDLDIDVGHISGGTQVVDAGGIWLALVHEAHIIPGRSTRYYQHRFVIFDEDGRPAAVSLPFVFFDKQIEFAAGMAYLSESRNLVVSFGVRDCEAWLAWMNLDEVLSFIG